MVDLHRLIEGREERAINALGKVPFEAEYS